MNLKSAIESILFIQGEPMAVSRLAKTVGAGKREIEEALAELQTEYRERGIQLVQNADEWQFATNPENRDLVQRFVSNDLTDDLTRASLEVIAIIAYKGPISRANIEYLRGVDSSYVLRNLLIRGLVTREENPKDRRSYLYRIATNFLTYIGASNLEALPHYEEFRKKDIELPIPQPPAPHPPSPNENVV